MQEYAYMQPLWNEKNILILHDSETHICRIDSDCVDLLIACDSMQRINVWRLVYRNEIIIKKINYVHIISASEIENGRREGIGYLYLKPKG